MSLEGIFGGLLIINKLTKRKTPKRILLHLCHFESRIASVFHEKSHRKILPNTCPEPIHKIRVIDQ